MILIAGLVIVPLVAALLLLLLRNDFIRTVLVIAAAGLVALLAVLLATQHLFAPAVFVLDGAEELNHLALVIDIVCCLYIIYHAVKASNFLVVMLAGVQCIMVLIYDLGFAVNGEVTVDLYVDQLSVIMALIIAVIGGAICIYSLGYMRDYQKELDTSGRELASSGDPSRIAEALKLVRDRRHIFFAVLFMFLSAMFALVFSNRLTWLFTAWEVTTLCSFVLIGFSRTKEATTNSFKAVAINLAGGLAFCLALIMVASEGSQIFELDVLISVASTGTLVLPVILIAFAGMTKAAQMPFQGWLLGAMVAPTPVSALLHSSTMVKAGVFIIIKLAPALGWNIPGLFVLIVGGLTFLCCSALAIAESNAKRVLAYSTVANLGLIICCAGIGTPEAAWAAIFLLIFHAAAKALLFCCVGTAEHHVGSRDIERMDNLFVRMPWIASSIALGIMAMFAAPFGMLVGKWAAIASIAASGHWELFFVLAFGSALTFVFWAKWLGKVLAVGNPNDLLKTKVTLSERFALAVMAFLLIAVTFALPYISDFAVNPYLLFVGELVPHSYWSGASTILGYDNLLIMNILLMVMLVLLVVQILRKKPKSNDTVYLAGLTLDSENRGYRGSFGNEVIASQRNWYMEQAFGKRVLGRAANILTSVTIAFFFLVAFVAELMLL